MAQGRQEGAYQSFEEIVTKKVAFRFCLFALRKEQGLNISSGEKEED